MAAVIFGNVLPRWFLRTLITHRWNNAETVPKAAAAGWEAGRGDSNWCKEFSCRHQVNLMAEREQIHANLWNFRMGSLVCNYLKKFIWEVIHVAFWDVETVETQLVAQDSGRLLAQVTAIIFPQRWAMMCQVSIIHPEKDEIVPVQHGEELFFRLCCLGICHQSCVI